jgi:hypothetical protein
MITITRLSIGDFPWRYALRITNIDTSTFQLFVNALKQSIDLRARKWSATDRCWLLRDADAAIALCERFGLLYECEHAESYAETPPTTPPTTIAAYSTLHLLPTAPQFVVHAVYRALAKQLHPDAGGNTLAMQRINAAMEVLR